MNSTRNSTKSSQSAKTLNYTSPKSGKTYKNNKNKSSKSATNSSTTSKNNKCKTNFDKTNYNPHCPKTSNKSSHWNLFIKSFPPMNNVIRQEKESKSLSFISTWIVWNQWIAFWLNNLDNKILFRLSTGWIIYQEKMKWVWLMKAKCSIRGYKMGLSQLDKVWCLIIFQNLVILLQNRKRSNLLSIKVDWLQN